MIFDKFKIQVPDLDPQETSEWIESIDSVIEHFGPDRAKYILTELIRRARNSGVDILPPSITPYLNTISPDQEPEYPGDEKIEKNIRRLIRWNAAMLVSRANKNFDGIGGHISTYASAASLFEVGLNHFFRGKNNDSGDQIFFQGHASPGIYARAFLEGRLSEDNLDNFRREINGDGLSSYPHPRLMEDFWEFPTVSMGLGPINAIHLARFNKYITSRGIADKSNSHVWAFLGDGECDEPETFASLRLAAREKLDNLTFVINCNLQRLDGPVRGNGKIIQEFEAVFRGAGWNVIKVIWGSKWDQLLQGDKTGTLLRKMERTLDGDYQRITIESGDAIRQKFFGPEDELSKLVEHLSDDDLLRMRRGGHDLKKINAAYKLATETKGAPTVILAKTVKGWALGKGFEARNSTHQKKKLDISDLKHLRDELHLEIPDSELKNMPYFMPPENSEELKYISSRRKELGGFLPKRVTDYSQILLPKSNSYEEFYEGTTTQVSTTMAFVRLLRNLMKDKNIGDRIVPIIPDEARTFGMDALFTEFKIYNSEGQQYTPVDQELLLSYKEAIDGQILEEGISEAGAMSSFTAAGMSYSVHREPLIPFYTFYSMFGFQRVGDLIWCAADARARGFLLGATAGRTTLNGEGLQHQDGHSLLLASTVPSCLAYDPAFAYETAVIVEEGLRQMYELNNDRIYYITLYNENYEMPAMPKDSKKGILKGLYLFKPSSKKHAKARLFGSGSIMRQVIQAAEILEKDFKIPVEIWSVPSYVGLRREALECEDWNRLNPTENPKTPYIVNTLGESEIPTIAASDYMKAVPEMIARWVDNYTILGTDGFGMSDTRESLRRHFQIDSESIVVATLSALSRKGEVDPNLVEKTIVKYKLDRSRQIHSS